MKQRKTTFQNLCKFLNIFFGTRITGHTHVRIKGQKKNNFNLEIQALNLEYSTFVSYEIWPETLCIILACGWTLLVILRTYEYMRSRMFPSFSKSSSSSLSSNPMKKQTQDVWAHAWQKYLRTRTYTRTSCDILPNQAQVLFRAYRRVNSSWKKYKPCPQSAYNFMSELSKRS